MGLFMLLFYTLSRNDTCGEWRRSACCTGTPQHAAAGKHILRTPKLYNNAGASGAGVANFAVAYKADGSICDVFTNHSNSRSNSQCSNKQRASSVRSIKSNERDASTTQHLLVGAASNSTQLPMFNMINNHQAQQQLHHQQQQQQQQVASTRMSGTLLVNSQDIPSADLFYNPNQINVARKFFKKQKRLTKRNNFELQRHLEQQHNCDDTSDISSLTGGSSGGDRYARRHHNAMTLLSGGGRKVNNTNIYYGAYRGANNATAFDDKHLAPTLLMTPTRIKHNIVAPKVGLNMVANIYTNIPETAAPLHEVIKMRGARLGAATPSKLAADVLSEHDEDTSGSMDENVPLYENTITSSFHQRLPAVTPLLQQIEVAAMNSLGLPATEPVALANKKQDETVQQLELDKGEQENENEDEDAFSETALPPVSLERNDIYISNSLQITDRVNIDDSFPMMTLIRGREQQQSKSLNNINDIFNMGKNVSSAVDGVSGGTMSATVTTLHPSHSSDSIVKQQQHEQQLQEKEQKEQQIQQQQQQQQQKLVSDFLKEQSTNVSSTTSNTSSTNHGIQLNSKSSASNNAGIGGNHNFYEVSTNCQQSGRTLSASPTNESDLNYQNSELSIRSHDVYAPQADNELNLTLTDDFAPYLISSNTSDGGDDDVLAELVNDDDDVDENDDDDDDDDDENVGDHDDGNNKNIIDNVDALNRHCIDDFNDLLATEDADIMNSSIDELYEAIKRRPIVSVYTTANTLQLAANNNFHNLMQKTDIDNVVVNHMQHSTNNTNNSTSSTTITTPTIMRESLNDTLEDDSSQSSVISYINPTLDSSRTPSS